MKALRIDDARKAGTDIGPVVDASQLAQDLDYIGIAKAEGGRLLQGGEALATNVDGQPGYFLTRPSSPRPCRPCASTARRCLAPWSA